MDDSAAEHSSPLRILIADDSDSDRLILKTLLKRLGHEVLDVANGLDAVSVFQREAPDLVLLDALMPIMDGMEAARQIKVLAGERLVPLIFLTSLSEAGALARAWRPVVMTFWASPTTGLSSKPRSRRSIECG